MQTFLLIDLEKDGAVVQTIALPSELNLELVRHSCRWQVCFKNRTPIANVNYTPYSSENHYWIARMVMEEFVYAYEEGELEPPGLDVPHLDIGGDLVARLPVRCFGVDSSHPLSEFIPECEHCGHYPCDCRG